MHPQTVAQPVCPSGYILKVLKDMWPSQKDSMWGKFTFHSISLEKEVSFFFLCLSQEAFFFFFWWPFWSILFSGQKAKWYTLFPAAGWLQIFKAKVKAAFGINARWAMEWQKHKERFIIPAELCPEGQGTRGGPGGPKRWRNQETK